MASFDSAIRSESPKNPIIAEIKLKSPMHPDLIRSRDPLKLAREFEEIGAIALSFITGPSIYGGNISLLSRICQEVTIPVLRKDFISNTIDIKITSQMGASAILLIASHLKTQQIKDLVICAQDQDLDAVVEVHTLEDLSKALKAGSKIIGINNRDINQLEMDDGTVMVTEQLCNLIPPDNLIISMSAIETIADLKRALGVSNAVLIGTALMIAPDAQSKLYEFVTFHEEY